MSGASATAAPPGPASVTRATDSSTGSVNVRRSSRGATASRALLAGTARRSTPCA